MLEQIFSQGGWTSTRVIPLRDPESPPYSLTIGFDNNKLYAQIEPLIGGATQIRAVEFEIPAAEFAQITALKDEEPEKAFAILISYFNPLFDAAQAAGVALTVNALTRVSSNAHKMKPVAEVLRELEREMARVWHQA